MFVLGGATTGLWLASTGLVRLERAFVLSLAGSCSFCSKDRSEVYALVGTAGRSEKICDECVGLGCDIVAAEMGGIYTPPDAHRSSRSTPDDEQFQQRVGEALDRLATGRETPHGDALQSDLRRIIESVRHMPFDLDRCSFCDAHRNNVMKLVSGPRVFICDTCLGEATAVVAHVLRHA